MIDKKVKGAETILMKEGNINLDSLYTNMKAWFDDHNYDFNEDIHQTKANQKGKKIKYKWGAKRKVTEYVLYVIDVEFEIKEYPEKELELKISSNLELDYENKWQDTEVKNKVFKIFNTLFKNQEILSYKKKLIAEVNDLIKLAKQELNLET